MNKSNFDLFKQAISEGLTQKIDSVISEYNEKVVYSEKHELAMRTIVYGKCEKSRTLSPNTRRLIAILVAAALVLSSCGIIFRDKLSVAFREFYLSITSSKNDVSSQLIEDIYELSYIPEGYSLNSSSVSEGEVSYIYYNENGDILSFYQNPLNGSVYNYDTENSTTTKIYINDITVYHTDSQLHNFYLWSDGVYGFEITSAIELSREELELMIDGLKIK